MHRHLSMLCALAATAVALADPGAVTWSGGTLRLMDEHPTVSLLSETIVLEPNPNDTAVTVDLRFHNSGEACVAQMGFPTLAFWGPGYHFVRDFAAEADGRPLPVTVAEEATISLGDRDWRCVWHLFEVPFGADADLAMTVRYREAREHYWAMVRVPYVLATGASWQGAVRSIDLQVRLADRRNIGSVTLGTGLPTDARPHREPLVVGADGPVVRWHAEDYDGTPSVVNFQAMLGPGAVVRDDGREERGRTGELAWWRDDRVLIEADYLADCLLATVTERSEDTVMLAKESRVVELPVTHLEGELVPDNLEFVDPAPAVEAFGGAVETSLDEAGDVVVSITTCPDSAESARETALFCDQQLAYRLKALRALADRWPNECPGVCDLVLSRDVEHAAVLAWCIGWMAEAGNPVERPWELVSRIRGERSWESQVAEAVLSATDGCEFAGALAMVEPNATGMRSLLIAGISASEDWRQGAPRGMNAGIALRRLAPPQCAQALMDEVRRHGGRQESEDAMIALGALGDDLAIDFLKAQALDPEAHTRDINCVAAQALALIGSPAALQGCLDLWQISDDREVQARAFRGLKIACGQSHPQWLHYQEMLPEWEPPRMTPEEGRRLCRELLAQVDPTSLDEYQSSDLPRLLRYIDGQEAGG